VKIINYENTGKIIMEKYFWLLATATAFVIMVTDVTMAGIQLYRYFYGN